MANPHKGEVDFSFNDKNYTLKFTNSGRVAAETELDMEAPEINAKMDKGGPGPRIVSALFFGATRKFHLRDFPNMQAVHAFMDEIEEADDDIEEADDKHYLDLIISLMAAYMRTSKKELQDRMKGVTDEDEDTDTKKAKAVTEAKKAS